MRVSPARALLLAPLLVLTLGSFFYVRSQQGDGGVLVSAQRHAQVLTRTGVDRVVKTAPDPDTNSLGLTAVCTPLGRGELHNPWKCSISYSRQRQIDYTVQIAPDGSYTGDHEVVHDHGKVQPGPGEIDGCCIAVQ